MSIPLEPQEQFVVVRQLDDHTDSSTYYVRATIRDAKTDTLLDRINLTDKGDRRFSKIWQVCPDPSGLGRFISILTEVFTDSNYTTKSEKYGDEIETYKVQNVRNFGGGGSVGVSIDYKKVKKLIEEVIDEKVKPVKIPEVSFKEVLQSISEIKKAVESIEMPEIPTQEPIDLSNIISSIELSHKAIMNAVEDIPGRDKNDIQPLADALNKLDMNVLSSAVKQVVEDMTEVMNGLREFSDSTPEFKQKIGELQSDFKDILYNMTVAGYKATGKKEGEGEKKAINPKFARLSSNLLKR